MRTQRVYAGLLTKIFEQDVTNYTIGNGAAYAPPRVLLLIGGDEKSLG